MAMKKKSLQEVNEQYADYGWARENGLLNEGQNADYRQKFALAKSGQAKFNKFTKWLREKADTKYATDDIKADLADIYNYVMSDEVTTDGILERVNDLVYQLVSNRAAKKEIDSSLKRILYDIRKTRISLDEAQIAEMGNRFGKDWRKRFFSKVIISEDGISLDSKWKEWANTMPEYFDADV